MNLYAITGGVLYAARTSSLKQALIGAVEQGADLSGVNLRRARLHRVRLDGLIAPGACLWGADLTGCDLAGADLRGADLRMATLADCCLAEADCTGARFDGAFFRQTLIAGAGFAGCSFSCPSILTQPLSSCRSLHDAVYWHRGEKACDLGAGVTRLEWGGHTIVGVGQRLIVNGELLYEEKLSSNVTTKSRNYAVFREIGESISL